LLVARIRRQKKNKEMGCDDTAQIRGRYEKGGVSTRTSALLRTSVSLVVNGYIMSAREGDILE
jgi:hypothetical protein